MTDPIGFHVDVARVESMEKDMTTMRMNVRDFDEAYEFLKSRGFKNASGEDRSVDSASARSCRYSISFTVKARFYTNIYCLSMVGRYMVICINVIKI